MGHFLVRASQAGERSEDGSRRGEHEAQSNPIGWINAMLFGGIAVGPTNSGCTALEL
jgi:hypothetical protein